MAPPYSVDYLRAMVKVLRSLSSASLRAVNEGNLLHIWLTRAIEYNLFDQETEIFNIELEAFLDVIK